MKIIKKVRSKLSPVFSGIVKSFPSEMTISVEITSLRSHLKYGKVVLKKSRLLVHASSNNLQIGDSVFFRKVSPISKKKSSILVKN